MNVATALAMNTWAGKVAIVTGASAGIGTAIAKSLIDHSIKVVGLARRKDKLQELAQKFGKDKFFPVRCDATKEEDILNAFKWVNEKLGGADILVNNAGVVCAAPIIDSPTEEYRKVLDLNLIAPAICAREFVKSVKRRNSRGHIVNINSIAGHYAETLTMPLGMYCASKYGLTALSAELRHEIIAAKLNIRVTSVSPGAVSTDLLTSILNASGIDGAIMLYDSHIADGVIYAIGAPEGAEVYELTIVPQNSLMGISIASK
nr:farnesol dehydrogenase-like [Nomia melanderi]